MGLGIAILLNGTNDTDLAQAEKVEVYERMGETTLYSIFFPEDINNGDLIWAANSKVDQGAVISIIAGTTASQQCLVTGPVYAHQLHLLHGGAGSTIEVKGADSSITMDRQFNPVLWDNVTDSDAVTSILGTYNLTPDVMTTQALHTDTKHSLVQQETDLRFVRRLARKNGCYFWITADNQLNQTGHFQQPQLSGSPAQTLVINMDKPNIQTFDINWNVENPTSVVGTQLDLDTLGSLDASLAKTIQSPMGTQQLEDITGDTRSIRLAAPADDAGDMQARSAGALIEADWFIRASCSTSYYLLNDIVRANTLVNVTGAGSRHSGTYLVYSVRHKIDMANHIMEIELIRNGWNSASGGGLSLPSL